VAVDRDICRRFFADLDARVKRAGIADVETARIQGFPYLRVNRFLASYRGLSIKSADFEIWVDRLQILDYLIKGSDPNGTKLSLFSITNQQQNNG
jgi:hypothetical protein